MSINPFYAAYRADPARIALEEMELYCTAHPGSPSATRRPALSIRSGLWIALLGPVWKKESLELATRWDQHFAHSTHNIWPDNTRRVSQMKAGQPASERIA